MYFYNIKFKIKSHQNSLSILLTPSEPSSLFVINSLFKLNRVNLKDFYYSLQEDFQKIGSQIGFELLKN